MCRIAGHVTGHGEKGKVEEAEPFPPGLEKLELSALKDRKALHAAVQESREGPGLHPAGEGYAESVLPVTQFVKEIGAVLLYMDRQVVLFGEDLAGLKK